jgi:hypothetical protein
MMMVFGTRHPDMETCPTPVGEPCAHCTEPIKPEDVGFMMWHMSLEGTGYRPWHRACHLRTIIGSADCQTRGPHVRGTCTDVPEGMTKRQAAEEAVRVFEQRQGVKWGPPPLEVIDGGLKH